MAIVAVPTCSMITCPFGSFWPARASSPRALLSNAARSCVARLGCARRAGSASSESVACDGLRVGCKRQSKGELHLAGADCRGAEAGDAEVAARRVTADSEPQEVGSERAWQLRVEPLEGMHKSAGAAHANAQVQLAREGRGSGRLWRVG
eukprot:4218845-Prymnesium_polylepis.1